MATDVFLMWGDFSHANKIHLAGRWQRINDLQWVTYVMYFPRNPKLYDDLMISHNNSEQIGVLVSGGLDSSTLLGELLRRGHAVQPIYMHSQLRWEPSELRALRRYLLALTSPRLAELVTLELPVSDLYKDHWSVTGIAVPDSVSPDEAVFLPGRNSLLIVKARLWCQLNGIGTLALATLGSSPFADASSSFFERFQSALNLSDNHKIKIDCPFSRMGKRQVMELGRGLPLELTFSCLAPVDDQHCGQCNKCAERQQAFRAIGRPDQTRYASVVSTL